jgi:hypothetical protein
VPVQQTTARYQHATHFVEVARSLTFDFSRRKKLPHGANVHLKDGVAGSAPR